MINTKDYNMKLNDTEDYQYSYGFDVMHPFVIKSFKPYFNKGNLLELGSFKGHFTKRLTSSFYDITCVEASDEAIEIGRSSLGGKINSAITPAGKEYAHHITYTLDILERDAKAVDLRVVYRSGVFFKTLANFQWDRLLETDIISNEYLEGCFQLGKQYPDLCSSIFLTCEKG
ncbi:MAG: hypothetical protein JKY48_19685 [Flavobacteriales bacterium]|nr:hypothetical protein [Flavobacteriales bacterium]